MKRKHTKVTANDRRIIAEMAGIYQKAVIARRIGFSVYTVAKVLKAMRKETADEQAR